MLATLEVPRRLAPRGVKPPPAPPPPPPPVTPHERLLENRHFRPVLVASSPESMAARRPFGGSILTHLAVGALIIMVTRPAPPRPAGAEYDTTLIFLPRIRAVETATPPPRPLRGMGGGGGGGGAGVLVVANPPPKGFQTVIAPTLVPSTIPAVNLNERALDPRDYTGIGVEGGVSYGVVGGTGKVDPSLVAGLEGVVYAEATPDVRYAPAVLVHQVAPVYPPALRLAGVEGSVDVRFVVDTLGRVEPASIDVLESTDSGFHQPARQAVLGARFNPARLGDARVRQLTKQRISFRLN